MKHVNLFEQFINEKVNIKKEIKYIADYYDDTETSGTEECGIEYQKTPGSDESDDPCKTADDFITYVNSRT